MLYNSTNTKSLCQVSKFNFLLPSSFIIKNLEKYVDNLTPTSFKLFKHLLWMDLRYKVLYPTQEHLAGLFGVSRQYINKLLKKFSEDGVIGKRYRHRTSCIYMVSAFFKSPSTRERLSKFFSFYDKANLWVFFQKSTLVLNNYIDKKIYCLFKFLKKTKKMNKDIKKKPYPSPPKKTYYPPKSPFVTEEMGVPESSYQRMLRLKAEGKCVPLPRKVKEESDFDVKMKFNKAKKSASPFARRLLEQFAPKFLVGS